MGDTPSRYAEPLQPQPQPLWAVDSRFCIPSEVTLHLKEKLFSWSGDSFHIKDPNTQQTWFQVQGRAFSLREKKTLLDNYGTPVLNMKETLLNFFEPNYKVYLGDHSDQELFKIVAKFTFAKAKASVQIVNRQTNQPMLITLKGNIMSKEAMVFIGEEKQGGIPIAKIYRPIGTGRNLFFDKQDYYITVAPNVDVSLVVCICIAMDEMKKDQN